MGDMMDGLEATGWVAGAREAEMYILFLPCPFGICHLE